MSGLLSSPNIINPILSWEIFLSFLIMTCSFIRIIVFVCVCAFRIWKYNAPLSGFPDFQWEICCYYNELFFVCDLLFSISIPMSCIFIVLTIAWHGCFVSGPVYMACIYLFSLVLVSGWISIPPYWEISVYYFTENKVFCWKCL